MWMCSGISKGTLDIHRLLAKNHYSKERAIEESTDDQPTSAMPNGVLPNDFPPLEHKTMKGQLNDGPVELREGQDLPGTRFHFNQHIFKESVGSLFSWPWYQTVWHGKFLLQQEDVRRWRLADKALSQHSDLIHTYGNCEPSHRDWV